MFKLESYLTPILLSYVDKYIKNFRPEDAQVSLWGGDASFHNLDLRLEVLEQELHLPLSFISGHIHDLIIHVPWTKLASEPITITINTIECILKLKDENAEAESNSSSGQKRDERRKKLKPEEDVVTTPPGYMQNLVTKIVNNICINCNNLILKYVEEDIVVSVNIRMLKLSSANQNWLPTFTDISTGFTFLRKLMTITDLTICLDKRNAAGKIDVYQEPMLYRCSLELRILQCYHPLYTKKYSVLRVDLHCASLEFSMTEQQIPMLIRLILLSQILMQRYSKRPEDDDTLSQTDEIDSENESQMGDETWTGWAWSFIPSIFPTADDEWHHETMPQQTGHTIHFGFYVDSLSFIFKISECTNEGNFYIPKKIKYWPLIRANVKGICYNIIRHGPVWTNIQAGVSQIIVIPQGNCCCGITEVIEGSEPVQYLHIGTNSSKYMDDSLFDSTSIENNSGKRLYNINWNQHLQTYTETTLLENTPAIAMDLVQHLELSDDVTTEKILEYNGDLEYSNIKQRAISRYVLGTLNLKVCSGLIHRITAVYKAAMAYDYSPYGAAIEEVHPTELKPPTEDDFETLNDFIPRQIIQFTSFNAKIELFLTDHVYFEPVKGNLRRRRKGSTSYLMKPNNIFNLPRLTIEAQCIDAKLVRPIYPNRLVYTTCQLPTAPEEMFEACHQHTNLKILGLASNVIIDDKSCTLLLPCSLTASYKEIILPRYWPSNHLPHLEINFKVEKFAFTVTKATLLVTMYIIESLNQLDDKLKTEIMNTTLLNDIPQTATGVLEIHLEDIKYRYVGTPTTTTNQIIIGFVKGFVLEQTIKSSLFTPKGQYFQSKLKKPGCKAAKEAQQVIVLSGPEISDSDIDCIDIPFFSIIAQFSKSKAKQVHPPLMTFHVAELRLNFDPLLCRWLQYEPKQLTGKDLCSCTGNENNTIRKSNYSESTSTAIDTPRRTLTTHESVHSSDRDRELIFPIVMPFHATSKQSDENKTSKAFLEQAVHFYNIWNNIILYGTISACIIYFPTKTLMAYDVTTIQEALDATLNVNKDLEVILIKMPSLTVQNSPHLQNLNRYTTRFPIHVPENIWQPRKTFFPWTVNVENLCCATLQNGEQLSLIKSITWNIAVDVSVKYAVSNVTKECDCCGHKTSDHCSSVDIITAHEAKHTTNALFCSECSEPLNTLTNMDLRVYVDTPPVQINISDQQVCLILHLASKMTLLFNKLFPYYNEKSNYINLPKNICVHHKVPGSTPSVSLYRESTPCSESISESPAEIDTTLETDDDPIKLSALFQWTLSRLQINVFSQDLTRMKDCTSFTDPPDVKMVVNVEDMFTSINLQKIYMKTETKISSMNIYQYKHNDKKWELGPFLGLVMRSQDEDSGTGPVPENQGSFLKITMTRARCDHVHSKWGATSRAKLTDSKGENKNGKSSMKTTYITEIDITVQPIDILISISTLKNFIQNFYDCFQLDDDFDTEVNDPRPATNISTLDEQLYSINNHQLPLLYIDCRSLRIIMPASQLIKKSHAQDVCIFQIANINLRPNAKNPICRTPLRPDMYQQAARAHILNIPGADIEDRQYELNISEFSIASGNWVQLDPVLARESTISIPSLRTMNENPALEWNNLENKRFNIRPRFNLMYMISGLNLSIIFAPAIVSSNGILICGHSLEINAVSDLELKLSTSQILLATELASESVNMFEPVLSPKFIRRHPKFRYSYRRKNSMENHHVRMEETTDTDGEGVKDSGVEVTDESHHYQSSLHTDYDRIRKEENPFFFQPESLETKQLLHVPVDVLITGGNMSLIIYQFESNAKSSYYFRCDSLIRQDDLGYEASEEGSQEELQVRDRRTQPLFYFLLGQPNIYFSRLIFERKIHFSIYDIKAMISTNENNFVNGIPTKQHFGTNLLETKPGQPNPSTGILPAFITIKWSRRAGNITDATVEISRPTKLHFSLKTWEFLILLGNTLLKTFNEGTTHFNGDRHEENISLVKMDAELRTPKVDYTTTYCGISEFVKYKQYHKQLLYLTAFHFQSAQIVFCLQTKTNMEVILGCEKISSHLAIKNRPERITNTFLLECLTLSVIQAESSRLLLNPWSVNLELNLFWESWQELDSDPQIAISVDTDCLRLDIGSENLHCLEIVATECQEFLNQFNDSMDKISTDGSITPPLKSLSSNTGKDQHYKDDLRAGAFQFVDANAVGGAYDELPLPYQVLFSKHPQTAMSWRYPQPRSLTKVRVFPVPFKETKSSYNQNNQQVLCCIEYWSEAQNAYKPFAQFQLSESELYQLEVPRKIPQPAVSCIWRVVLLTANGNDTYNDKQNLLSPRALAACIRIDSYFNPVLIPTVQVSVNMSTLQLHLYNYLNKKITFKMPPCMSEYTPDQVIPENQCFLVFNFEKAHAYTALWASNDIYLGIGGILQCFVLDYAFLSRQHFIEQSSIQFSLGLSDNADLCINTKPIKINFGPSIGHTLAISMELWGQTWTNRNQLDCKNIEMVVLTRYVICNDTVMNIKFGQAATDEDIYLASRHCHLYCWRSQKCKQLLRVAIDDNGWIWSVPFEIGTDGTRVCIVEGKTNVVLYLTVKSLSTTQKQIIFSSDLIVVNNLCEQLELKVLPRGENKDVAFKMAETHLLVGKSRYPSLRLGADKSVKLRVRYYGLESAWSGDIPVMENTSCDQPWLVKVPLHERGHFLSVWCQIIVQHFNEHKRFLAVFWPLFMIRSNLPVDAKVNIETPTLQVALETTIAGRGKLQQLYCPGTTDHSHQLTFKLESSPPSNPYVPLNYSLVNQKEFFKKPEKIDIDEILTEIQSYEVTNWPFCEESWYSDWDTDDQPLTHVQVRYDKICPYSSSLLIELLPWCLMINITGNTIALIVNAQEICRIGHYGIATPPKFQDTFCFGFGIHGTWYVSHPIELSAVPISGNHSTIMYCDLMICRLLITSYERNEMRIMTIGSSHILTNTTDFDVYVSCVAIPKSCDSKDIPNNLAMHSFRVPAKIAKNMNAIPLTQWIQYGSCEGLQIDEILFYLFFSIDNVEFSRPIRVDRLSRQTFSTVTGLLSLAFVVTVNENHGCLNVTIHRDTYPQLLIENNTKCEIVVGEHKREKEDCAENEIGSFNWLCTVKPDSIRHYTMPSVTKFFPDISRSFIMPKLTVAANIKDGEKYEWCQGIDLTTSNETYIRTHNIGDIKITVSLKCHTTQVSIDSVSQAEFSAGDVRNRLQMVLKENLDPAVVKEIRGIAGHVCDVDLIEVESTVASTFDSEDLQIEETKNNPIKKRLSSIQETKKYKDEINSEDLNTLSESSLIKENNNSLITKIRSIFEMKVNTSVNIQGIVLTLTKDLLSDSYKTADIAAFYLDQLVLRILDTEDEKNVSLNISDVQFDNQLYSQGTYDFPVVFRFDETSDDIKDEHAFESISTNITTKKFVEFNMIIKKWTAINHLRINEEFSGIHTVYLKLKPFKAFVEGEYITELTEYIKSMMPVNLVILPQTIKEEWKLLKNNYILVNENLLLESEILAKPIKINSLIIEPVMGTLSIRSHIKIYIALDDSPVSFQIFQRKNIITTPYRLGHALTVHFLSGAIVGAGWMVGALEILGNPGGLARSVGVGLKDFISKPYEGIMNGPWGLVVGVSQGSASLVRNITAGTLNSVSKFAGSLARNLDIMSLDGDHLQRAEEARRQRPSGMVSQIAHGFTNFGISILGAVGGLAQQPLQSMVSEGASPKALVAGFGKGIMGIITKPIGGAAELVSVTGNAILQETGWKALPNPRCTPVFHHIFNTDNASVKYCWKLLPDLLDSDKIILCDTEATMIGTKGEYHAVALILTVNELILVNTDEDTTQQIILLKDLEPLTNTSDPTLLSFNFIENLPNENILEMDPAARARVVDYVRSTVSGLSDIASISSAEGLMATSPEVDLSPPALMFYVNPQWRNYFLNILSLAKRHSQKRGFSVL